MTPEKDIYVYADWAGLNGPLLIGRIHAAVVRGQEALSFEYDSTWLKRGAPILLDPKLHFGAGRQYAENAFGLMLDSAPDRWGRTLIQRREALRAKEEGRSERPLFDSDYLLEVHDISRMGALRFKTDPEGPFQSDDQTFTTPPLHALRELEQAAIQFEENNQDDPAYKSWLNQLLAPGTSLGGARPKANVIDPAGQLWIAKFPSKSDEINVGAWERVAYHLAKEAELCTAPAKLEQFSNSGHTFLIQRFDRAGTDRIHFASALNLLGYQDGDGAKTGASYLDLAELITQVSEAPDADLEELWKRIVFNVCISNTDDHLRNHGFLLGQQGWRLSPVYDLNPQPWGAGLALNINETSNTLDLDLAIKVAPYFRIKDLQRDILIKHIRETVQTWEAIAQHLGISSAEINQLRSAFRPR